MSKKDRLAQQLMLPRMNKNSKKILVQKKKKGGPVFQKYDVKKGVIEDPPKSREPQKLKPIRPITPTNLMAKKPKSRRNNELMRKMFYSKKELLRVNKCDFEEEKTETKEEIMYRMLRNKGKVVENEENEENKEKEEIEENLGNEVDSDPRRLENYRNKNQRRKPQLGANSGARNGEGQSQMKKSNSMLPVNKKIFPRESPMKTYGQEQEMLVPPGQSQFNEQGGGIRKNNRRNLSSFNMEKSRSRDLSVHSKGTKKSTSMRPNKTEDADPFKNYRKPKPKYDKNLLREILELEDRFVQDFSKHIDSMVALVKKDIGIQTEIQDERGHMKFEESLSRVMRTFQEKRRSMDRLEKAVGTFREKLKNLQKRKNEVGDKEPRMRVPAWDKREQVETGFKSGRGKLDMLSPFLTGQAMYGKEANQPLKPLNMKSEDFMNGEERIKGLKMQMRNLGNPGMQMMREKDPNFMRQGKGKSWERKELRPINGEKKKQVCMLPKGEMRQRNLDENGKKMADAHLRMRTDTGTSKDLMKDLDFDNEMSLI